MVVFVPLNPDVKVLAPVTFCVEERFTVLLNLLSTSPVSSDCRLLSWSKDMI